MRILVDVELINTILSEAAIIFSVYVTRSMMPMCFFTFPLVGGAYALSHEKIKEKFQKMR